MEHSYIILYDLCAPNRNYEELYKAIKAFGTWGKITESAWAVVTSWDCIKIRDYLMQYIDKDDRLFVLQSGQDAAWYRAIAESDWFKINLVK